MEILNDARQLNLILDLVLIAAVIALAIIWLRNGARQRKLEAMLAGTAAQLTEASRLLEQASRQLQEARDEQTAATNEPAPAASPVQPPRITPQAAARKAYAARAASGNGNTQAERTTLVLRLHREGASAEAIAQKLDIPLAQVRLLLKLQGAAQPS